MPYGPVCIVNKQSSVLFLLPAIAIPSRHFYLGLRVFVFSLASIFFVETVLSLPLIFVNGEVLNLRLISRHFICFVLQVSQRIVCFKLRLRFLFNINEGVLDLRKAQVNVSFDPRHLL